MEGSALTGRDGAGHAARRSLPTEAEASRSRKYKGRVVVVTHRVHLPRALRRSSVELDIAMQAALADKPVLWVGWSGEYCDGEASAPELRRRCLMLRARIDLPRADHEGFYERFAKKTLWPVFHSRAGAMEFDYADYAAYMRINDEFARQLLPLLDPNDLIWIHDYHLIPLAGCLRARGAKQKIGFFQHIPFPPPEILATLPMHDALMRAFAEFDLIGFNAAGDAASFASYFTGERKTDQGWFEIVGGFGREFGVGVFPIGIDVDGIASHAAWAEERGFANALRERTGERKLISAVGSLDSSKGLLRRLKAIEVLLDEYPEYRRMAMVHQIALPSGDIGGDSQGMRKEVHARIKAINRRFGAEDNPIIRCAYALPQRDDLFAQLRMSAVGMATPLRDGMNLTVKEFIACQDPENPGIPILSRFTGAAHQLDAALIVNPYDEVATARAIRRALTMPLLERLERHGALLEAVRSYDVFRWRDEYLSALWQSRDQGEDAQGSGDEPERSFSAV